MGMSVVQTMNQSFSRYYFTRSKGKLKTAGSRGNAPQLIDPMAFLRSQNSGVGSFSWFGFPGTSQANTFANVAVQVSVRQQQTGLGVSSPFAMPEDNGGGSTTALVANAPSRAKVQRAVDEAGGEAALENWVVDGKTKLSIDGWNTVVDVDFGQAGQSAAGAGGDSRSAMLAAIGRFGLGEDNLRDGVDKLRRDLKDAAGKVTAASPGIVPAVEYALEDAFAKIDAWETAEGGRAAESGRSYREQLEINLGQAESAAGQMGMDLGQMWGMRFLAEDLAVFGLDLAALAKDSGRLSAEIAGKAKDMLAELDRKYVGTEKAYYTEKNQINGALSRLTDGLGRGGSAFAGRVDASAVIAVKVGGVSVSASVISAASSVVRDPLVFDLAGDGIDLSAAEDGVFFDMTGEGEKTRMGFIRGDDALLFLDEDGDNIVSDGRELFGNVDGYADGWAKLAAYDENGDGVIDENDSVYDKLRLWREVVEDGVCELSETMSLREAGIKSISLRHDDDRVDDGKGNIIASTGSFERSDGGTGKVADVWLREMGSLLR